MDTLKKKDGTIYKVFTPFFKYSSNFVVEPPNNLKFKNTMFLKKSFDFEINLSAIQKYYSL